MQSTIHGSFERGPFIRVTVGKRPAWLADSDPLLPVIEPNGKILSERSAWAHGWDVIGERTVGMILRADHWAYPVIEHGFEPWSGGDDDAPFDDISEVLFREGSNSTTIDPTVWRWKWLTQGTNPRDIIGFKRKPIAPLMHAGANDYPTACRLYEVLHAKFYPESNHYKPAPDVAGVLMQIDHITAKLERVDGVHKPTVQTVVEHLSACGCDTAIDIITKLFLAPPVDPDLIKAREIADQISDGRDYYKSGKHDNEMMVQAALAGLKHGKE